MASVFLRSGSVIMMMTAATNRMKFAVGGPFTLVMAVKGVIKKSITV